MHVIVDVVLCIAPCAPKKNIKNTTHQAADKIEPMTLAVLDKIPKRKGWHTGKVSV
jgi:hypothetical protein